MGSLIDELGRREAGARAEAEELRGRIAELAGRLAGVEERLSRLVITRETVEEVLGAAAEASRVSPAGQAEEAVPAGSGRSPAIGAVAVPPWRAGLEVSVLPQDYRDLLEVTEDAGRPLRAAQIAAAAALMEPYALTGGADPFAASADLFAALVEELQSAEAAG